MKKGLVFLTFLFVNPFIFGQDGFQFETKNDKVVIPFQLINNLIFIPIHVNGVELNFLVDTGVQTTLMFGLEDTGININNVEKIKLSGLGSDKPIEGLKSTDNVFSVNGLIDKHHEMYIILNQSFNLSLHIGIPVNGVIGYNFFENNLIEINYKNKKITVHKMTTSIAKRLKRKYTSIPISIEKFKPYVNAFVTINNQQIKSKLLLDVGNSDALWIFQDINPNFKVPLNNFQDYLGQGFSGDIFGKRTRISKFSLNKFEFKNLIIAMPDSNSVKSVSMVPDRVGSIGSEIFKRFSIVFDYKHRQLFLKKNRLYNDPFHYNLSGIEVQNSGMEWVKETVPVNILSGTEVKKGGVLTVNNTMKVKTSSENLVEKQDNESQISYKFSLKPMYTIISVRPNSPGDLCGLQKGDIIKSINNKSIHKYSLEKINNILQSKERNWINMEIQRSNNLMKFKFQLKNIL